MPITPVEDMVNTSYDVLIVGSGAGGGAALWRLCSQWERRFGKIGMIEAGDLLLPSHGRNLPTFDQKRLELFKMSPHYAEPLNDPDYPGLFSNIALGGGP